MSNVKENTLLDAEKLRCRVSYSKYKNSMLHWQKNKNSFTTINIENANLNSSVFVFAELLMHHCFLIAYLDTTKILFYKKNILIIMITLKIQNSV